MSQVFISYKAEERAFAELVKSKLESENFNVWMDQKLYAGTRWKEEIDEEIRKSFALIVIMTPAAKESEYVTYEWTFACGAGMTVLPLIFKPVDKLHTRLDDLQRLDFSDKANQPWDKLISGLQRAQSSQLTIHHAIWGAESRMKNVTDKVKRKVSAGRLDMLADPDYLNDPAPNERKKLVVVYSHEGKVAVEETEEIRKEEKRETGRLILPK